jgi:hypothetical protein
MLRCDDSLVIPHPSLDVSANAGLAPFTSLSSRRIRIFQTLEWSQTTFSETLFKSKFITFSFQVLTSSLRSGKNFGTTKEVLYAVHRIFH